MLTPPPAPCTPITTVTLGMPMAPAGCTSWDDPVSEVEYPVPDPAWMSDRIKQVARTYGANLVGDLTYDRCHVGSTRPASNASRASLERITSHHKHAIVMGIEMDWEGDQIPHPGRKPARGNCPGLFPDGTAFSIPRQVHPLPGVSSHALRQ